MQLSFQISRPTSPSSLKHLIPSNSTTNPMNRPIQIPILIRLFLFTVISVISFCSNLCSSLSPDGMSLLALKSAVTSDPHAALSSWTSSDDDPCHWIGVTCANISGYSFRRVVAVTVSSKNLTGYLPSELGNLVFLRRLNLHGNYLSSEIPPHLSNASSLHSLFLYSNNFSGGFPVDLCLLPRLQNLDLSRNSLSGNLPPTVGNCRQMQRLSLSHNGFSGELPADVWMRLENLIDLDISRNGFTGRIPAELGELKLMTGVLNLSYNEFEGKIPVELGMLSVVVILDVRGNKLSGEIPRIGALKSQGAVCFSGNDGLCGDPLPVSCESSPVVQGRDRKGSDEVKGGEKRELSATLILLISAANIVGVSSIGIIVLSIYWKMKNKENICSCIHRNKLGGNGGGPKTFILRCCSSSTTDITTTTSNSDNHPSTITSPRNSNREPSGKKTEEQPRLVAVDKGFSVELDELLRSSAYLLGKSAMGGIVYKVVLGNGMAVVVRRLGESSEAVVGGRWRDFAAEVEAIGKVKHPNVVRLKAYYWSTEEKLLVNDFVSNGNLASALKGRSRTGQLPLSWAIRLRIAKGTARGLAYLHNCSPKNHLHGNIKPTNILLDDDFNPLIADFGLVRLIGVAGEPSSSTRGAFPYIKRSGPLFRHNNYRSPEGRFLVSRPNQKWDVYSFGVVLLELLTGRSPEIPAGSPPSSSSSSLMDAGDLVRWVRGAFDVERSLSEIVDAVIIKEVHSKKDVTSVIRLALACTETDPDLRPKMKTVYDTLARMGS